MARPPWIVRLGLGLRRTLMSKNGNIHFPFKLKGGEFREQTESFFSKTPVLAHSES